MILWLLLGWLCLIALVPYYAYAYLLARRPPVSYLIAKYGTKDHAEGDKTRVLPLWLAIPLFCLVIVGLALIVPLSYVALLIYLIGGLVTTLVLQRVKRPSQVHIA